MIQPGLVDALEPHLPPLSSHKKWNAHFWITFNFWCSAGLVDGFEPHLPPLCIQKHEILHFWITFNFWWSARLVNGLKPHLPPLSSEKMKCLFLDYIQLLMIGQLVHGLEPHLPPLSSQKNEMLIFGLRSTSDDQEGWLIDSNPICHPSASKNMKYSFLDYIQLPMIRPGLVNGLKPHLPPLSSHKNEMLVFSITFNFWWLARLVHGLEPHLPPLSSQKNEMLIFGLRSTSDDQARAGWSHSNPICHPSPAKKMKCSFLEYVQLLMISLDWSMDSNRHPPPLSSYKHEMLHFWITFNFWWLATTGWCTRTPFATSSPAKKMKCSFLDYIQLLMIGRAGRWTWTPSTTSSPATKHEMPIFGLCSTSDDQPGWSMDSNPICHPSPAKKNEMFIFGLRSTSDDRSGLVDGREPHPPPISSQETWNASFWVMFNFWWSARLVDGLKPHLPPISSQKHEMLVLDYIQLLMISRAGQWTQTPSATSYPAKKNEMLIFGLHSTSDDKLDWSMDSNAIHHPSPAKNMKCLFLDYIQLLMIGQAWSMHSNPICHPSPAKKMKCSFLDYIQRLMIRPGLVDGLEPHLPPHFQPKKWNAPFYITFKFWW